MCITVIPGQTGCLVIRDVKPMPRRHKTDATPKVAAQKQKTAPVVISDEPRFSGGTLEKKSKNTMTYRQYKRNVRANNNRQHSRRSRVPSRLTIRRFVQMTEREWDDVMRIVNG